MIMDEEEYSKYFVRYGNKKMGEKLIADKKFVMCVRSSFKNYLQKLNSIKTTFRECFKFIPCGMI